MSAPATRLGRHDAYRRGLCVDCRTAPYSAGRPRCKDCHTIYAAGGAADVRGVGQAPRKCSTSTRPERTPV